MIVEIKRNSKGEVTSAKVCTTGFNVDKDVWKVILQIPDLKWQLNYGPFLQHRIVHTGYGFNIVIGQHQIKKLNAKEYFPSKDTRYLKGRLMRHAAMILANTVGQIRKPRFQDKILQVMVANLLKKDSKVYTLLMDKDPECFDIIEKVTKYYKVQIKHCGVEFQKISLALSRRSQKLMKSDD